MSAYVMTDVLSSFKDVDADTQIKGDADWSEL